MTNKNITNPTALRIFAAWEKEGRAERPRTYLGASIVGHQCDMYLWLNFRGVFRENFDGRMYRLFNRGQREEAVFCDDLRRIGCEVKDRDEKTGQQFAVSALGGHFAGHLDAVACGFIEAPKTWHVCEFKTHSDASFKKLCKEGVAKAKPMHYAQMQCYMGLTEINRAFYMAVDKDNDDLWCERVEFNKNDYEAIMARAKHLIDACEPERCASRPDDYRCKACPCHSLCWRESEMIVDPTIPLLCRTCCHSTAITDGEGAAWSCRLGHSCGTGCTCADHLILPIFVNAEIVDGSPSSITYKTKEGTEFTIGKGGFSCEEIKKIKPEEISAVIAVKNGDDNAKVIGSNSIEDKWSKRRVDIEFEGTVEQMGEWCANNPKEDWTKPTISEEFGGKKYYEYDDFRLVIVDGNNAKIVAEKMPF